VSRRGPSGRARRSFSETPHPLEIVEAAHFRAENVHDHFTGVHQHPISGGKAFNARVAEAGLLETLGKLLGDRSDLSRRSAAGNNHVIGDARFTVERDGHHFLGLIVIERFQDQRQARLGLVRHGDCGGAGLGRLDLRLCHRV